MTSKVTRSALVALTAVGAGALGATPAVAAIPTFYVKQPAVNGVKSLTPESAVLTGAVDTGGDPLTNFTLAPGASETWANSFTITNTGTSAATEFVDGLPANGSQAMIPLTPSGSFSNAGATNYTQVVFEYDPLSDYAANGNNPGPQTGFAQEVDVPTAPGTSTVSAAIGVYPAAAGLASGTEPLLPGTKYIYWITSQPGVTDSAQSYNTYDGKKVTTNPTYSCMATAFASVTAPYSTYTSSGTITSAAPYAIATAPQIQGPCLFQFGGSANYYTSNYRTFTTPKLGTVAFASQAKVSGGKASLKVTDKSGWAAKGTLVLEIKKHGKLVVVASGPFKVAAKHHNSMTLKLTHAGAVALKSASKLKTKVVYTSTTDQPTNAKSVTLVVKGK